MLKCQRKGKLMKYEIDKDEKKLYYDGVGKKHILYRIVALKDIFGPDGKCIIKKGQKGGWIEESASLSQNENCFILGEAKLLDKASVYHNAIIKDNAVVSGAACIKGKAIVSDDAVVTDYSIIEAEAKVCDRALLKDLTIVSGKSVVMGDAIVSGHINIQGKTKIKDLSRIYGKAFIEGNVTIAGATYITGKHKFTAKKVIIKDSNIYDCLTIECSQTAFEFMKATKIYQSKISGITYIDQETRIRRSKIRTSNLRNAYAVNRSIVINSNLLSVHISNSVIENKNCNGKIVKNNVERASIGKILKGFYK